MTNDEEIRMLRAILADAISELRRSGSLMTRSNAEEIEARLARLDAKIEED